MQQNHIPGVNEPHWDRISTWTWWRRERKWSRIKGFKSEIKAIFSSRQTFTHPKTSIWSSSFWKLDGRAFKEIFRMNELENFEPNANECCLHSSNHKKQILLQTKILIQSSEKGGKGKIFPSENFSGGRLKWVLQLSKQTSILKKGTERHDFLLTFFERFKEIISKEGAI